MSCVFCGNRKASPKTGFSIFKVKVITPATLRSQDYNEEQVEKPSEGRTQGVSYTWIHILALPLTVQPRAG